MAGRVAQGDIEELKERADIIEIIGSYVSLKPASSGSFKGLCPFHDEKSPSFNVRANPAFYHCFGCGAGGDIYKFIQEIESVSFADSVQRVADKAGYQLKFEEGTEEASTRSRLLALNKFAAEYYQSQLETEEGLFARDFLVRRGFAAESFESFGIGYAPKGWQNLITAATGAGYQPQEMVSAGLAMESDKGGYDRFRGRVLWPIRDANSQVLGFGARRLYEEDQGPKYLNTPETPVYHKSSVLYGLDLARKSIVKTRQIVVVEGYTDVMACHLAGIQTAVATCGTAFGEDHIKIINRLLGQSSEPAEVIFTFDPDAAGEKAALRVYGDSSKFNALTFVAGGPEGLDPADLRQKHGDQAIPKMLEQKKPLFEFVIRHRISQFSLQDLDSRVAAARSAAPVVAEIKDSALRAGYTKALADWVSLDSIEIEQMVRSGVTSAVQQRVEPMRQAGQAPKSSETPQTRLEKQILEVLVQAPTVFSSEQLRRMTASGLSEPQNQRVLEAVLSLSSQLTDNSFANLLVSTVEPDDVDLVRAFAMADLPVANDAAFAKYSSGIVKSAMLNTLSREKLDLMSALRRVDATASPEQLSQVQRQLVNLESERRDLMK
ncbi:DNA primase [Aquiluna sp.]|nr:DNA primase [Aquiluna sp.]MDA7761403.1 DNA primase [Aquiluna sp.]MDA9099530.1 DNA primase [Aquiluna sp.]